MKQPAPPERSLACVVLAAGRGERFGSDKRRARLPDGRELLKATLANIPGYFDQYLLVLHPGDEAWSVTLPDKWRKVIADDADKGMAHSLRAGICALQPCQAAMIMLGDMPAISQQTFTQLQQSAAAEHICIPRYQGHRGNPVVIGSAFFNELLLLQGDQGARQLFANQPQALLWLDLDDPAVLQDVDQPADLQQFRPS